MDLINNDLTKYKGSKYATTARFNSLTPEEEISRYIPLVNLIVHRLRTRLPNHVAVEDLTAAGMLGLLDALKKFDSRKNVPFKIYAEFRIKGAILDELRSLDWAPRAVRQRATQLEKVRRKFEGRNRELVKDEEMANELGLSIEKYYKLVKQVDLLSSFTLVNDSDFISNIEDEKARDPLLVIDRKELKQILTRGIETLSANERTVIYLYYYNGLVLRKIGKKLGLTESRACQIHRSAISKLRSRIKKPLGITA